MGGGMGWQFCRLDAVMHLTNLLDARSVDDLLLVHDADVRLLGLSKLIGAGDELLLRLRNPRHARFDVRLAGVEFLMHVLVDCVLRIQELRGREAGKYNNLHMVSAIQCEALLIELLEFLQVQHGLFSQELLDAAVLVVVQEEIENVRNKTHDEQSVHRTSSGNVLASPYYEPNECQ